MIVSKPDSANGWVDPDDAPELTDEWFNDASLFKGGKLIRRGRPRADNPKELISLRLDHDLVERLRATGPGWQSRINETLRKAAGV